MKIGVYGGTFNPPHLGHLIVIESLQDQMQFDKILFVPCASPPHKSDLTMIPAELRLVMTKLAISDNPAFEVSDVEIERGGISYSIDTLRTLRQRYTTATFSLIIGIDNYVEFHTWKSPQEILTHADLIVMSRPGFTVPQSKSPVERFVQFVTVPHIGISGTEIRRRVKHGRSIRYLVPRSIEEFIQQKQLYRD